MSLKGRIDRLSDRMNPNEGDPEELETWARLFRGKANMEEPTSRHKDLAREFIAWCHANGKEPGIGWLISWPKS